MRRRHVGRVVAKTTKDKKKRKKRENENNPVTQTHTGGSLSRALCESLLWPCTSGLLSSIYYHNSHVCLPCHSLDFPFLTLELLTSSYVKFQKRHHTGWTPGHGLVLCFSLFHLSHEWHRILQVLRT